MEIVSGVILVLSCLSILFFLIYVKGMPRLPGSRRPKTPTYDRFGRMIGETENPGYQETEAETQK